MDTRSDRYAEKLSQMIQVETISTYNQTDISKFLRFHELLRELFPNIFSVSEYENFGGSFLLRWKGSTDAQALLFMNHHDVVEASGAWRYPPFSGTIADGKVWGRGTLDTKGGLWAMLQAADELAAEGYIPTRDIYFESACTEECDGSGANTISQILKERGIRFFLTLDEGGMIMYDPIGGADGTFAMVGTGEKSCADVKFIARSNGGHASTPGKNTPLVRLGKFMAAAERSKLFTAKIAPTTAEMFSRLSTTMHGPVRFLLRNASAFSGLLGNLLPSVSPTAGAMLKTTLAFTMAGGSDGTNVLPQEAWVIGNMRFSHHEGAEVGIAAVSKLAAKYDIETVVIDPPVESGVSDYNSDAFRLIEKAVAEIFPGVSAVPYITNTASDSRYMARVCDNCLRLTPFTIDSQQLDSIHGIDENIDISALAPAVDFYRYVMTNV